MDSPDKFAQVFATLCAKYVERARSQRERLAALRGEVAGSKTTSEVTAELLWICHSLHGASGTFGYADVGDAAAEAERLVKRVQQPDAPEEIWRELDAALGQLHRTMEQIPHPE